MNLAGKKLLVLGGNVLSGVIVTSAQSMGVYTIVADWYDTKRSPTKLLADEFWNEDIFKSDRIALLIKEHQIDGVITGFTDSYLLQYQRICELAELPCYSTKEIFEITLDKSKFKDLCRHNDVPTVPDFSQDELDVFTISSKNKILIKPVDNSGSRGIVTCDNPIQFQSCLDYALSFSSQKKVVIEKYLDMDTFSVSYTIQDGVISMSTMNDRIVHKVLDAGAVTNGGIYPSKYIDSYMGKMDMKVRHMYKKLGVKNGVLFIQGFTDGEEYYFYEMGYRLSGGQHFIFTENQNNSSSVKQLIHFALTGSMADYRITERDNPKFQDICFQWNVLGKEAVVDKIEGLDLVNSMPQVISWSLDKKPGDQIGKNGTTAQKILGLHMVVKNRQQMLDILKYIYSTFKVYDNKGINLVLNTMNENLYNYILNR